MYKDRKVNKPQNMIYGLRSIEEAVISGKEIEKVLIQKNLKSDQAKELVAQLASLNIPFSKVPEEKLNRITRKNHQGFICFLSPISFMSIENIIDSSYNKGVDPMVLVLDRVTDVRNFGAICRTAECAGADAIVVPATGGALISGDAMKSSAGALNHLSVCRANNLKSTVEYLKNSGLKIVACTEKTDQELYDSDLKGPLAIIMGSEEDGISEEIVKISDVTVKIPMKGKIGSLNVSVSSGVIIYEAVRQRSS